MARPLRIEYAGAVYHLMAQGNGGDAVFRDEEDQAAFLKILAGVCADFEWRVLCYCLMETHIHLVVATGRPTLSRGMRQLLGVYSQSFNRRHGRAGHLFQGRYKALLVETSAYLVPLCGTVLRSPVTAGLVTGAKQWPWSSYGLNAGKQQAAWFDPVPLWDALGVQRAKAAVAVAALARKDRPAPEARGQLCYGGDAFAKKLARKLTGGKKTVELSAEHPRRALAALSPSLNWYEERYPRRSEAMARACLEGHHSRSDVARHYGVAPSTVSRAAQKFSAGKKT